jgi:ABC-type sugar transport system ATPase subunit
MNVMRLSGGNQQKAVLARWLMLPADVFLLDEPTEGVDVHARHEIYQVVRMLADAGKAVILSSSDVEEVVEHTDRVLVMREGAIVDELLGARRTLDEVSRACLY